MMSRRVTGCVGLTTFVVFVRDAKDQFAERIGMIRVAQPIGRLPRFAQWHR